MEALQLKTSPTKKEVLEIGLEGKSIEEQVKLSILRDLISLDWKVSINNKNIEIAPPSCYDKKTIRKSMSIKRDEIIRNNKTWIDKHIDNARGQLACGVSVLHSKIAPIIEVCENTKQHDLFRIFRYYWSSPYSEYVGRRIRLLIRDAALKNHPIIGIAALGSPIIHIPERDDYIGWSKKIRTDNLIYAMDAYVIGALPPYNYLLGGKLISYILASDEVRKIYKEKYRNQITMINKRKASDMACLFTTGLYGKSSQYNRLKYDGQLLYKPIGETKGYGTLHLTEKTIELMREFLNGKGISIGCKFGDGPSWRMRLIRTAGDLLDFNSDFLLKHSFKRAIYFTSLAENSIEFLRGDQKQLKYYWYPKKNLVDWWKYRWLGQRKENPSVIGKVLDFTPQKFEIAINTSD